MRGIFLIILLTLGGIVMASPMFAQTHTFDIRIGSNNTIGTIEVQKKENGTVRHILIKSRVQMMLLSKMNSDLSVEFRDNLLLQARSVRQSNKSGEDKATITKREGNDYVVVHNGDRSVLSNTNIQHTVAELYFSEPRDVSRIFSETLGQFLTLKALGNGQYELNLPEGKRNIYKYNKGLLVEVEVNHTLGKAYFKKTS